MISPRTKSKNVPVAATARSPSYSAVASGVASLVAAIAISSSWSALAAPHGEPIQPLPAAQNVDPRRAEIGRRLFYDARLSGNGTVSCASCHDTTRGGADGRSLSIGVRGEATSVNTPTVFNAALNFVQFWNGRADSLEAQVDAVVQNPVEMGGNWKAVVGMVSRDSSYSKAFTGAYVDGVTRSNIQNAIASFERTLLTPNARFDNYLRGVSEAITPEEKAGYAKFKQYGCISCHQGVSVGGNMFQKFGVMEEYAGGRAKPSEADLGRFLVTGEEDDKYVFKVPSLRNVTLTAPYFHDGSAQTLDVAVDVMFRYQLGRTASKEDKASIVAFLKTLTGEKGGGK